MRLAGQLVVIALLGGAGYGGWYAYKEGHLAKVPYLNAYLPAPASPAQQQAGGAPRAGGRGAPAGPVVVDVDTVRTARIVELREALGTVRAFESITVASKVAGVIEKVEFAEGQKVKTGDILIRLDSEERRADIEAANAEIRRAAAQRNEIATRLERAQALRRTGSGTEAQVEDLTAQVRTLEGSMASADARKKAAEARLEELILRAPFSGRMGTRAVSVGAYVSPGTRISTLDDLSKVRLDFSIPENLLGRVSAGQSVRALSAAFGERVFRGKVSVIDTRVDPATRTLRLTAEIENPDEALKPGMFLSVALEVTTRETATVVPEEAIVSEGLRHILFVVKDNKVDRRVVRIGQRQEAKVEVLEGVAPGESIVVRGLQRVRPGATVTARGGTAARSPPPAWPAGRSAAPRREQPPPARHQRQRRRAAVTPKVATARCRSQTFSFAGPSSRSWSACSCWSGASPP
jgi:membrane fusion protein (multidrug efflux system)